MDRPVRPAHSPEAAPAPAKAREGLDTGSVHLDLIRFAAALMIALYHFINIGPGRIGPAGAQFREAFEPVAWISSSFWVAVQIFFVLSGVVIAFSADGRSAVDFISRRALRLYPAALICATITVLVWPKDAALERYVRSVTLWPEGPWVSDVYWTMAVEITFYAMVAATLALWGSKRVVVLGGTLALLSGGWWALRMGNAIGGGQLQPIVDTVGSVDEIALLRNGGFFALGILLYALYRDGFSVARLSLAAVASLAGLAAVVSASRSMSDPAGQDGLLSILLPSAIWAGAVAAIALSMAMKRAPRPGSRSRRAARRIGLATYPLYLVHAELGIALMLVLAPIGPVWAMLAALALVLLAVVLIMGLETAIRGGIRRLSTVAR